MEKLTRMHYGARADHYLKCSEKCEMDDCSAECSHFDEVVERLAAYEDTERTPEEVRALNRLFDYALTESRTLQEQLTLLKRLRELAEADKDGRLVALPSDKALTNADRMRAATNQQLAKLLYDNQKEFCRLMYKNLGFEDELNFSEDYSDILAWLNAPSEKAEKALEAMKDE